MKKTIAILILAIIFLSFQEAGKILFIQPNNFPKPEYDFAANPLTEEKILLGKTLFNDPILSSDNTISCSSCHSPYSAFAHNDHDLSHGINNKIGTRNAPSLFNLAWQKNFMWDGSIHHLDVQALAPITNSVEMNETLENITKKLQASKVYTTLFYNAYKDSNATGEKVLKSISQFLVTIVSSNSKYDKVIRKEKGFAFNEYEQKGYQLFQQNCANCHTEPLFTNNKFENNGLAIDSFLHDVGRMKITNDSSDILTFKVPSLRNCEVTYPYMHDGRYKNLQMVLFHYTQNIHHSRTLAKPLQKQISLTEEDKNCLIAFLKTLTDENFLNNEKYR